MGFATLENCNLFWYSEKKLKPTLVGCNTSDMTLRGQAEDDKPCTSAHLTQSLVTSDTLAYSKQIVSRVRFNNYMCATWCYVNKS